MKQIFALFLICGSAPCGLLAQAGTPASSGVYTKEQAARGGTLYLAKCGTCHGAELAGDGTNPALAGPDFLANWTGQPITSLFDKVQVSMPADQPGSLSAQQVADVLAFILSSNRYPAGQTELPAVSDRLKQIFFDRAP